jgi:ribosomal protein S18 acetylase RimI-like enzyme
MVEADIEAVAALARVVWQDAYPGIISQEQIDYMLARRYDADALRAELASAQFTWDVLLDGGIIVGFASCLMTELPGEMKLDKLYVHPESQRRGHGERLVRHCAAQARTRGCRALVLAVNKRNARAIAAYRKYGFRVRESVVKDIGNGFVMDDFIMTLDIDRTDTEHGL